MVLESNTYIDISPYHEILSGMNFILSISVGVVKLTGPTGTGKTRLLQQLENELQAERQETLLFLTAPTSIKDLHDTISRRLKLDNEFGFNKALIHHIIAKPYDQQRLVIMFDNAENIDIDVLLAIALFRNIMHNNQPIVSIVLCGSDALDTRLEDTSYRPLVTDMLISYEISPLTREQLQAYGNACADIHRLGKLPLKNGILAELLAESKGLPGAVPELLTKLRAKVAADASLIKAEEVAAPVANAALVAKAVPEAKPVAATKPLAKAKSSFFSKPAFLGKKAAPVAEAKPVAEPAPVAKIAPAPVSKAAPTPVVAKEVAAPVVAKAAPAPAVLKEAPAAVVAKEIPAPVVAREAPAPAPVAVKEAPAPVVAKEAAPIAPKEAPAPKAAPAPVKAAPVIRTEPVAQPAPVAAVAPLPMPAATPALSPDERLILASRAEKEAAAERKFALKLDIDWERWKPLMKGTVAAALLVVVGIVAWPRIAPTVSDLYVSMTSPAPEPAPVAQVPPPVAADEAPEAVAETPTEAAPVTEEEAVAQAETPAPVVAEPEPAVAELEPPQVAATEPAPAPAPPAPRPVRIPGPTVTNASPDELETVIRDWLMAWEEQDVDDFFRYYHTDFAPLYQDTLADWRVDRQTRISQPASIMIEVEDFMVGETSRLGTKVSFWMSYEAPGYTDRTLKEVLIGPDLDGQWRILQEYNQQVDGATRAALVATAPQGTQRTNVAPASRPQSAFPGAVEPPPVASRASFTEQQIDEIARFLAAWLTAWQNQDPDEYFRHYDPTYKPDFMASRDEWRNQRIERINRPMRIMLRMDRLEIIEGDDDSVRVQLVLEYHSTLYADRTVKEIELRKDDSGAWLIAEEKNRVVEPLPLMRLLPIDSLAFLVLR